MIPVVVFHSRQKGPTNVPNLASEQIVRKRDDKTVQPAKTPGNFPRVTGQPPLLLPENSGLPGPRLYTVVAALGTSDLRDPRQFCTG